MGDAEYPEWQKHYRKAVLEVDSEKMARLVTAAEKAMCLRLQELQTSSDGQMETKEIQNAINGLSVLKKELLNFPD